jgi:hypothetical protein
MNHVLSPVPDNSNSNPPPPHTHTNSTHLCVFDVVIGCCDQVIVAPLSCTTLGLLALGLLADELQLMRYHLERVKHSYRASCITQTPYAILTQVVEVVMAHASCAA